MRNLSINEIEKISGGGFCRGFSSASSAYGAGVLLNLWNPAGQVGIVAILAVNVGCLFV